MESRNDDKKKWIVRPCTLKDLKELYRVSAKVLKRHIKANEKIIGKRIGRYYMMMQVINVIRTFGPPPDIEVILPNGVTI